jgi:hypothetical protein
MAKTIPKCCSPLTPLVIEQGIVSIVMRQDHTPLTDSESKLPFIIVLLIMITSISARDCIIALPA